MGCCTGIPWELLFTDDLAIVADSLDECVAKLKNWKDGMESKGLRVNMRKTKLMISGHRLDLLRDSGAFPCAVCRTGVGTNSIQCSRCRLWVHKSAVVSKAKSLPTRTMCAQDVVT